MFYVSGGTFAPNYRSLICICYNVKRFSAARPVLEVHYLGSARWHYANAPYFCLPYTNLETYMPMTASAEILLADPTGWSYPSCSLDGAISHRYCRHGVAGAVSHKKQCIALPSLIRGCTVEEKWTVIMWLMRTRDLTPLDIRTLRLQRIGRSKRIISSACTVQKTNLFLR